MANNLRDIAHWRNILLNLRTLLQRESPLMAQSRHELLHRTCLG